MPLKGKRGAKAERAMNSNQLYEVIKHRVGSHMKTYFRSKAEWQLDTCSKEVLTAEELNEMFCKPHGISLLLISKETGKTLVHHVNRMKSNPKPTLALNDDLSLCDPSIIRKRCLDGYAMVAPEAWLRLRQSTTYRNDVTYSRHCEIRSNSNPAESATAARD
jgi:hypothetical protein